MKLKEYILFGIVLIAVIFFFLWKMDRMEERFSNSQNALASQFNNSFKQLSDNMSAQSSVQVVTQPGVFDKLFNTALNAQYKEIRKMIPVVIQQEIKKIKLDNKFTTTTINKSSILIEGDSVMYKNADGVITKTAKIVPATNDSSILIIVPQEIEITNVNVQPDPKNRDSLFVFLSAFNKTTGDTLKVFSSKTYVLKGKSKPWQFGFHPYIGADYDLINKEFVFNGGICPVIYNGKKVTANIGGVEFGYGLSTFESIQLKILQLQLNR